MDWRLLAAAVAVAVTTAEVAAIEVEQLRAIEPEGTWEIVIIGREPGRQALMPK